MSHTHHPGLAITPRAALLAALLAAASACFAEPEPGQRWPGPCEARWDLYETLRIRSARWVTPFREGPPRVMRFTWDAQGLLSRIDDDHDGDGAVEVTTFLRRDDRGRLLRLEVDRGADGTLESSQPVEPDTPEETQRIWSHCQGVCTWDHHGNLLIDSAADGQDVLRYDYGCWTSP